MEAQETVHSECRVCRASATEAVKGGGNCRTGTPNRSGGDVGVSEYGGFLGLG